MAQRGFKHVQTPTNKLDSKACKGRRFRYRCNTRLFHMYNLATENVLESRNVVLVRMPPIVADGYLGVDVCDNLNLDVTY